MWAAAGCLAATIAVSKISSINDPTQEYLPPWLVQRVKTQILSIAEWTAQSKQTTHPIRAFQLACQASYSLHMLRLVFGDKILIQATRYDMSRLQQKLNTNMEELLKKLQSAFASTPPTPSSSSSPAAAALAVKS